ncbi:integrase catalytic subunit [Pseudomonas syringae pv. actinidiae ICMP 19094]|nr:integrase catalytic subunit [Pseudomonas syringae pv. actinidiae ICMP 19094]
MQRWTQTDAIQTDARTTATRPTPPNALNEAERQTIVTLCNSPEYAHLPPSQIVPRLADQGRYLASEATFYPAAEPDRAALGRSRALSSVGSDVLSRFASDGSTATSRP